MREALNAFPMVWLQYFIFTTALAVALWEHFRKPTTSRMHRWLVPVLLAIACGASVWLASNADRQAKRNREDAEVVKTMAGKLQQEVLGLRADALTQMSRIEGKMGSEQMTERYLEAVRNLTQQYANANTTLAADKFFGSKDQRNKLRQELMQATSSKMLSIKIRFQPICDLAIAKFQKWHVELERRDIKTVFEKTDSPIVTTDAAKRVWQKQAFLKFESVGELSVTILQAVVEDARCVAPLQMFIQLRLPSDRVDGWYCVIDCNETSYTITNHKPGRFAFLGYSGNSENPIEDKEFLNTISDALDQIIGYTVDLASSNSSTKRDPIP